MKLYLQEHSTSDSSSSSSSKSVSRKSAKDLTVSEPNSPLMSGISSANSIIISSSNSGNNGNSNDVFTAKILQLKKDVSGLISLFPEHTNDHYPRITHIKSNVTLFSCYEIENKFTLAFFALYDRDNMHQPSSGGLNSLTLQNMDTKLVDEGMNQILTNLALIIGKILATDDNISNDSTKPK
jgi:hypothetical protein